MTKITVKEKINTSGEPIKIGTVISINAEKLVGVSTKSLYIRKGFLNGTLFLSQRGNGNTGAGDICKISEDLELEVNQNLFSRIYQYAEKAEALIK